MAEIRWRTKTEIDAEREAQAWASLRAERNRRLAETESRPTRARGLKLEKACDDAHMLAVAPRAGAWVETTYALRRL